MNDRPRIKALIDGYLAAYENHDGVGCASFYTQGALVLSPWGAPLRGRSAIADAHRDWFAEGERNKVMTIQDLKIDGKLAVCLLRYNAETDNGPVFGASLHTLERQSDGGWKIQYTSLHGLEDETTGFEEE